MKKNDTIFMSTTKKSVAETIGDIQGELIDARIGVTGIQTTFEGTKVTAITFSLPWNGQSQYFRLPCRWEKMLELLRSKKKKRVYRGKVSWVSEDDALRVAWRQVYHWIRAQLALIATDMAKPQEVFIPYMMLPNTDETVYEAIAGHLIDNHGRLALTFNNGEGK